jgi:hypothetical protein
MKYFINYYKEQSNFSERLTHTYVAHRQLRVKTKIKYIITYPHILKMMESFFKSCNVIHHQLLRCNDILTG